jgi:signal transduction histidine kinase
MSIGRLFNLCMVIATLIVVLVAGQALMREATDYRARVRAIDVERALEASLRLMEKFAVERAPTFPLLTGAAADTPENFGRMFAARAGSAEAIGELRRRLAVLSDADDTPVTARFDILVGIIGALDNARHANHLAIDKGLARPPTDRNYALMTQGFVAADEDLLQRFVPLLNALQARVATRAAEAASVIQIARYAADLRERAGRQLSLIAAAVADGSGFTAEELRSADQVQGEINRLRIQIDAGIEYVGRPPALVEAWRRVIDGYFTRGRTIIDRILKNDSVDGRDPSRLNESVLSVVAELRDLSSLRDASTSAAIEVASRSRDVAWNNVLASGSELVVVVAVVSGLTFWFRRRVVSPLIELAIKIMALAGGKHDVEIGMTDRQDEVGGLARAMQVFHDALIEREQLAAELRLQIAERINAEAAREDLQDQLLRSKKMEAIGTMAGGVAHELNNLLQPILMLAEVLVDQLPEQDQESREDLATIVDHAERARHIVGSIVTFARKKTVDVGALDVAHEMRGANALLRSLIPDGVDIDNQVPEGPCLVMANRTELMQVVTNLVINASQAMNQHGSVHIALQQTEIAASEAADLHVIPGNYADLSVTDTGSGIEAKLLDRIFEPFFTTKPAGQGTGLGLSVAYGIVRAWKGAMRVHSEVGRGTKFSVLVPIFSS